jgi:hypothetical protein
MTRNDGAAMTAEMKCQHAAWRRREQRVLAKRVLAVVGVDGDRIRADALRDHEHELRGLLGHVRACFASDERRVLCGNNQAVGAAAAKLALRAVGHPLEPQEGGWLSLTPRAQ